MEKLVCFFLNIGDVLDLQFNTGETKRYQVIETDVVPMPQAQSGFKHENERVTIVTKFPFDSIDSKERMLHVAVAQRISDTFGLSRSSLPRNAPMGDRTIRSRSDVNKPHKLPNQS